MCRCEAISIGVRKAKVIPDECGFSINPNLASAYRDIQLELRALVNEPTRKIPAIAEKIKKLQARSDAIRRRLQVPCPTKYGNKDAANDCVRLMELTSLRDNETALTEAQQAEEAHLRARFDVFSASPESVARRRREALQDAERRFKMSRLTGEFYAAPLSRKDRNELKLLRWLYPESKRNLFQLDGDWLDVRQRGDVRCNPSRLKRLRLAGPRRLENAPFFVNKNMGG